MTTPRRVVIAGSGSPLGQATARRLRDRGHTVIEVRHSDCDLTDFAAVTALARTIGPMDGLIHLVGGWRGGGGLAGQSDEDWDWLAARLITTLRNTTRAFLPALAASPAGRVAIVSSTGLAHPSAGNANYLACKAAAEAWLGSVGQALRATASDGAEHVHVERVMALTTAAERAADPARDWSKYTDVEDLAARFAGLWD